MSIDDTPSWKLRVGRMFNPDTQVYEEVFTLTGADGEDFALAVKTPLTKESLLDAMQTMVARLEPVPSGGLAPQEPNNDQG